MDEHFSFESEYLKVRTLNDYLKRLNITTKKIKCLPMNKNT